MSWTNRYGSGGIAPHYCVPAGVVAILDWRADVHIHLDRHQNTVLPQRNGSELRGDDWRNVSFRDLGQYSYLLVASAA